MPQFSKSRHNISEFVKQVPDWIKYDKSVNTNYEYRIVRTMSHDGLVYHSYKLLGMVIDPLLNMSSYYSKTAPEGIHDGSGLVKRIEYTIGDIYRMVVFGDVDLPFGKYPGQRECVFVPVVCKYIMKDVEK